MAISSRVFWVALVIAFFVVLAGILWGVALFMDWAAVDTMSCLPGPAIRSASL